MGELTLLQQVLVASTVVSAGASIQQGRVASQAEKERQRQLAGQIEQQNIQTLDESLERRRQLALQQGEAAALGAQGGFDPTAAGSSFLALREETERLGQKDVDMIRLVGANRVGSLESDIRQSRIAGRGAMAGGLLTAAGTAADGFVKVKKLG